MDLVKVGSTTTSYSWTPTNGNDYTLALACRDTGSGREVAGYIDGTKVIDWQDVQTVDNYGTLSSVQLYSNTGTAPSNSVGAHFDKITLDSDETQVTEGGGSSFFRPYFITG